MGSVNPLGGPDLIEPVPAPVIFVSGIGKIKKQGTSCVEVVLYVEQCALEGTRCERAVVVRLIGEISCIARARRQLREFESVRHEELVN